jgi:hypothetical protein
MRGKDRSGQKDRFLSNGVDRLSRRPREYVCVLYHD